MSKRQIWVPSKETGLPDSTRRALALDGPAPRNTDELQWRLADKAQDLYDQAYPNLQGELDCLVRGACSDCPPSVRDCLTQGRERLADLAGNPAIISLVYDALSAPPEEDLTEWEELLDEDDFFSFVEGLDTVFRRDGWPAI